jgi:hypothetical protein
MQVSFPSKYTYKYISPIRPQNWTCPCPMSFHLVPCPYPFPSVCPKIPTPYSRPTHLHLVLVSPSPSVPIKMSIVTHLSSNGPALQSLVFFLLPRLHSNLHSIPLHHYHIHIIISSFVIFIFILFYL